MEPTTSSHAGSTDAQDWELADEDLDRRGGSRSCGCGSGCNHWVDLDPRSER